MTPIHLTLIVEDQLSEIVARKILEKANRNYQVKMALLWNKDIVPRKHSTSRVGPDYNGRISEFVREHWDVETASHSSPSLQRAFARLKRFTPVPNDDL